MNDNNIQFVYESLEPIMKKAGEILLSYFKRPVTVRRKGDDSIVTDADLASESFLKAELSKLLPEAAMYAEESGHQGNGPYCFVIDPLDGTTNFSRGIGYFCISVCLTYYGEPVVGAIYQPLQNDYFIAIKGGGMHLSGVPFHLNSIDLASSMVVISLPYQGPYRTILLRYAQAVIPKACSFRSLGASALDLANIAAGRIDGIFLADHAWWDVAAGSLLIAEAGGLITDFSGKPLRSDFKTCIAGSQHIYPALKELLNSIEEG